MGVPAGCTWRRLGLADVPAVHALGMSRVAGGSSEPRPEAVIRADWIRYASSFTAVGCFHGEELIAYAEVRPDSIVFVAIAEQWQGQGITRFLLREVMRIEARRGTPRLTIHTRARSPLQTVLRTLGWREAQMSWTARVPQDMTVSPVPLPAGYEIADATPADHVAIWNLVGDAYLQQSRRHRQPFSEWLDSTVGAPDFEPWRLLALRRTSDNALIGTAFLTVTDGLGTIDRMVVAPEYRRQTFGQSLTTEGMIRLGEHGARIREVTTDSWPGVETLVRVGGLRVVATWVNMVYDFSWAAEQAAAPLSERVTDKAADQVLARSGVFLTHTKAGAEAVAARLRSRGVRVLKLDAATWADEEDMFADLAREFEFPPYYSRPGQQLDALTDFAAAPDPSTATVVVVVTGFHTFHATARLAALRLADDLAAAGRTAGAEGRLLSSVLHTDDAHVRLASAGAQPILIDGEPSDS